VTSKEWAIRSERGFSLLEMVIAVAITLILASFAVSNLLTFKAGYDYNTAARELAAVTQKARGAATSTDTRYRISVDLANGQYQMDACTTPNRPAKTCTAWTIAPDPGLIVLPPGVTLTTSGISSPPPGFGTSVTQAQYVVFNSRGIQIDDSGNPVDARCVYLQGKLKPPVAVCTSLSGRTGVYRLTGTVWNEQ
jgi:prepilin-type N-terminal cleavage/methylation domain-containing protein